jgi:hypothetical protein
MAPNSRGFGGRRRDGIDPSRIPPGQCYERGFPVLSAWPTPRTPPEEWTFSTRSPSCEAAVVVLLVPAGYVTADRRVRIALTRLTVSDCRDGVVEVGDRRVA